MEWNGANVMGLVRTWHALTVLMASCNDINALTHKPAGIAVDGNSKHNCSTIRLGGHLPLLIVVNYVSYKFVSLWIIVRV